MPSKVKAGAKPVTKSRHIAWPCPPEFSDDPAFVPTDIESIRKAAKLPLRSDADPNVLASDLQRCFYKAIEWRSMYADGPTSAQRAEAANAIATHGRALLHSFGLPADLGKLSTMQGLLSTPTFHMLQRGILPNISRVDLPGLVLGIALVVQEAAAVALEAKLLAKQSRRRQGARPDTFAIELFWGLAQSHEMMFGVAPKFDGDARGDRAGPARAWLEAIFAIACERIPNRLLPPNIDPVAAAASVADAAAAVRRVQTLSGARKVDLLRKGWAAWKRCKS